MIIKEKRKDRAIGICSMHPVDLPGDLFPGIL